MLYFGNAELFNPLTVTAGYEADVTFAVPVLTQAGTAVGTKWAF